MIVSEAVGEYLGRTRAEPDPVLAEMEEHGAREGIPIVVPTRALPDDGVVVSFEIDEERWQAARGYLTQAGLGDRVDLRLEDAREGLQGLDGDFDFVFLDGVKAQYGDYFELALPLLRSGGLLTVDNALRGGRVAEVGEGGSEGDEQATAMREFNRRLLERDELTATITPVGDGVLVAVKDGPR